MNKKQIQLGLVTLSVLIVAGLVAISFGNPMPNTKKEVTIEFKAEGGEITPEQIEKVKVLAEKTLEEIKAGKSFEEAAKELENNEITVTYQLDEDTRAVERLQNSLEDMIVNMKIGEITPNIAVSENAYHIHDDGTLTPSTSIQIAKLLERNEVENRVRLETITFRLAPEPWINTGLDDSTIENAKVVTDIRGNPYIAIQFNEEGAKLLEEITRELAQDQKKMAIFVKGKLISSPTVSQTISGGDASISGEMTAEEAEDIVRQINER